MQTGSALGMQTMDQHLVDADPGRRHLARGGRGEGAGHQHAAPDGGGGGRAPAPAAVDHGPVRGHGHRDGRRSDEHHQRAEDLHLPARSRGGKVVKGSLNVQSEALAVAKLERHGPRPGAGAREGRRHRPADGDLASAAAASGSSRSRSRPGSSRRSRQAGVPLLRALTVVAEQTEHPKLKTLFGEVARDVEQGRSFSAALGERKRVPAADGEHGARRRGRRLPRHLARARSRDAYEKEAKLRATIKSAMTYPIAVLGIAVLAVIAMLLFIVPVFKTMFEGLGSQLPLPTQILVDAVATRWSGCCRSLIVVAHRHRPSGGGRTRSKDAVRRIVHPIMLQDAGLRAADGEGRDRAVRPQPGEHDARPACRCCARSTIVGQSSGNWVLEQVARCGSRSPSGTAARWPRRWPRRRCSRAWSCRWSPSARSPARSTRCSRRVADFYDAEIDATAEALTSLIEPMLITVLGVVVGGMVVALYMPIFASPRVLLRAAERGGSGRPLLHAGRCAERRSPPSPAARPAPTPPRTGACRCRVARSPPRC